MTEWPPYKECQECSVRLKCILGLEYGCGLIYKKINELHKKYNKNHRLCYEDEKELEYLYKMPAGEGITFGDMWKGIKW